MTRQQLVAGGVLVIGVIALLENDVDLMAVAFAVAVLVPSVILHEAAHAASANAFGDDTAKRAGRVSLNPVRHVDPFGSIILPTMLALATNGAAVLGYAKPVPVAPRRMRDPRNHPLLVSLAGPATNVVLALAAALVFRTLDVPPWVTEYEDLTDVQQLVFDFGTINVILAVFNLLPIPPLDGSAMVERVLPMRYWESYLRLRQYSFLLLVVVIFVFPLERLFLPVHDLWTLLL